MQADDAERGEGWSGLQEKGWVGMDSGIVSLFRGKEKKKTCQAETSSFGCLDAENDPKQ